MTEYIRYRCGICSTEFAKYVNLPMKAKDYVERAATVRCVGCNAATKSLMILPTRNEAIFMELTVGEFEERWG